MGCGKVFKTNLGVVRSGDIGSGKVVLDGVWYYLAWLGMVRLILRLSLDMNRGLARLNKAFEELDLVELGLVWCDVV